MLALRWGYNGYIRMPRVRVYDNTDTYSLDVYWYKLITPADVKNLTELHAAGKIEKGIFPPDNWSPPPASAADGALAGEAAEGASQGGAADAGGSGSGSSDPHKYDLLCNEEGFTAELPGG